MQSPAIKVRSGQPTKGLQYAQHARNLAQMQVEQRNRRMNVQYQNVRKVMRGNMPKGVAQNGFKRTALEKNRLNGNPMVNMGQTNKPNMTGARVQRDGSQMDMNGQHAPSPNSNEIAPSPNKRPRVEGAINNYMRRARARELAHQAAIEQQKNREEYSQSLARGHRAALSNAASLDDMTSGEPSEGQLLPLEQQSKFQLFIARQEQDSMSVPHQQPIPQQVEAMRNAQMNGQRRGPPQLGRPQQMMQDWVLAQPAAARWQEYEDSQVLSIQKTLERNHAPPPPNQTSETAPRKKGTKGKKKPAESNGGNAGVMKRRIEPTISRDYSSRDNKRLRSRFMALQKRHGV